MGNKSRKSINSSTIEDSNEPRFPEPSNISAFSNAASYRSEQVGEIGNTSNVIINQEAQEDPDINDLSVIQTGRILHDSYEELTSAVVDIYGPEVNLNPRRISRNDCEQSSEFLVIPTSNLINPDLSDVELMQSSDISGLEFSNLPSTYHAMVDGNMVMGENPTSSTNLIEVWDSGENSTRMISPDDDNGNDVRAVEGIFMNIVGVINTQNDLINFESINNTSETRENVSIISRRRLDLENHYETSEVYSELNQTGSHILHNNGLRRVISNMSDDTLIETEPNLTRNGRSAYGGHIIRRNSDVNLQIVNNPEGLQVVSARGIHLTFIAETPLIDVGDIELLRQMRNRSIDLLDLIQERRACLCELLEIARDSNLKLTQINAFYEARNRISDLFVRNHPIDILAYIEDNTASDNMDLVSAVLIFKRCGQRNPAQTNTNISLTGLGVDRLLSMSPTEFIDQISRFPTREYEHHLQEIFSRGSQNEFSVFSYITSLDSHESTFRSYGGILIKRPGLPPRTKSIKFNFLKYTPKPTDAKITNRRININDLKLKRGCHGIELRAKTPGMISDADLIRGFTKPEDIMGFFVGDSGNIDIRYVKHLRFHSKKNIKRDIIGIDELSFLFPKVGEKEVIQINVGNNIDRSPKRFLLEKIFFTINGNYLKERIVNKFLVFQSISPIRQDYFSIFDRVHESVLKLIATNGVGQTFKYPPLAYVVLEESSEYRYFGQFNSLDECNYIYIKVISSRRFRTTPLLLSKASNVNHSDLVFYQGLYGTARMPLMFLSGKTFSESENVYA
ncbi:hypothetical protein AYI68_g5574 [Smittium mucronatum]|uniref:Uncharacterized protein n=1 Tax=Smittium mucronatum TaxID=133383 RepID=A0A1R0GTV5_9FUNG|nr:hypothetical protein AYI68_g5574 [Smittium mucronatum]